MSALNNAWNNAAQQAAQHASHGWNDPRGMYGNGYQQAPQGLRPMSRPAPRGSDIPVPLYDEIAQDPNAQRVWEEMDADSQWRMIERYQKQQEEARMQAIADAYDPNNDNAYSVSLSTAVDLWRAKHGDAWVRAHQTYAEDDIYGEIQVRLTNNKCFEQMEKHSRIWLRLKENV
jgi:phage/plasmid-associated DNA primase